MNAHPIMIKKIISSGQPGADVAALDAAIGNFTRRNDLLHDMWETKKSAVNKLFKGQDVELEHLE